MAQERSDSYLDAYLEDLVSQRGPHARFTAFLSPAEQLRATAIANKHTIHCTFFGGYEEAERKIARFSPTEEDEDYPCTTLQLSVRNPKASLRHGDFLGAVLGTGLKREAVGDIVLTDERNAVLFILDHLVPYLIAQLDQVGREPCTVTYYDGIFVPDRGKLYEELTVIVASDRIDCFVAALTNLAREKSAALLRGGKVFLNEKEIGDTSKKVHENDILVIRGYGKFRIGAQIGTTQKGRLRTQVRKYK